MADKVKIENGQFKWEGDNLYVVVDQGVCTACGSCMCWSPEVFTYNELSIAENRLDKNSGTFSIPEVVWEDVIPTLRLCPVRAIKGSDQPFVNFQKTEEFGTESPDNPNITYKLEDNEWTVNEFEENKDPEANEATSCGCNGSAEECTCGAQHNQGHGGCGCH